MDISQTAFPGGVSVYTNNLSEQLSKNQALEMIFFYSSLRKKYKGDLKNVKKYKLPPTLFEMLFNKRSLKAPPENKFSSLAYKWRNVGIEKFIGPVDIFHSSDWTQPPSKAKKVTTYHDVVPLKYPQWSHPKIVAVHTKRLKIVEKEIDSVIAVSETTKRDLLEISKIPENKITVIYEGVGENFKVQNNRDIANFKKRMGLPDEFILAIGGVGERRNLDRVKQATQGYNLVISGTDIPWLDDSQMPLLYASAKVVLYPSLYEGFGLAILEAMSVGIPVITSNVSSMPEVGGQAALYVNPLNVDDIKKSLRGVMEDEALRKTLIKKGFENAKKFTWLKTAQETFKIYQKLYKDK